MIRKDLRAAQQTREIAADLGLVAEADGSAQYTQGKTIVVASVLGPTQPRYSRHELFDRASVEVEVTLSAQSKENQQYVLRERKCKQFLKQILTSCIDLQRFPRLLILFKVLIICDDGSLLASALNAAVLALLDSGIPMKFVPNAVSLVVASGSSDGDTGPAGGPKNGSRVLLLLDPTAEEENSSLSSFVFAINPVVSSVPVLDNSGLRGQQDVRGDDSVTQTSGARIVATECSGQAISTEMMMASMDCAVKTSYALVDTMKRLLSSKLLPELEC